MSDLLPTRRSFPRARVTVLPGGRGMRGILSLLSGGSLFEASSTDTGQPWWVPDIMYTWQGKAAPDAVYAVNQANNAEVAAATINPITGQPVQAAVDYMNLTQNAAGSALSQGQAQSTGSALADSLQSLLGGTSPTASSSMTMQYILIALALGAGVYFVVKKVL